MLAKTNIKTHGTETKLDDIGELVKTLGGGKGNSLEEKLKACDNLTTIVPLNGKENWDEVIKNALIYRRSKFDPPQIKI